MNAQHVASEDLNLDVDTKIGSSPYKFQHGECLVRFTDPGADIMVSFAGCCHFGAKIGEFFNVF